MDEASSASRPPPPPPAGSGPGGVVLAPMAGFTDAPMRFLAGRFGAALTHTEMANARGLALQQPASWRILDTWPGEGPVAAHLYGAEPEDFAEAAALIEAGGRHAAVDINCGCPAPKVLRGGCGAALMADPRRIGRIVEAVVRRVALPVTVKTRLGLRPGEPAVDAIARHVADAGASAIAIHARYASQYHSGPVDEAAVARIVALGRLRVIANGGIRSPADALRMLRQTGADAVMVGWGAVGNPWLLRDCAAALSDPAPLPPQRPSLLEVRRVLQEHLELALRFKQCQWSRCDPSDRPGLCPEDAVVLDVRTHLFRYLNGLRGVSRLRGELAGLRTLDGVWRAVEAVLNAEADFRARVGRD